MDITVEQVIKEQTRLEKDREQYEKIKTLCIQMAYPDRSDQWDIFGIDTGKANTRRIFDPTGAKGLDTWANGIVGHWMPKDINWFNEELPDRNLKDSKETIQWLQDTDDHLQYVLRQSNYHEQKRVVLKDAAGIGDAFLFIDEDEETGKQMMQAPHPREFFVKRDFWGRVIGIHHKFKKTISQIKEEFGMKALSEDQRKHLEQQPDQPVAVIHAIYKNKDYQPGKLGNKNMPWRSVYINVTKKIRMEDSGYETLNPIPWSLNRPSHENYGRGIVSQLLIEIMTANLIGKDMLAAGQQAARPSMLFSKALKQKLSLKANAVNFVGSKEMQGLKMGDLMARIVDPSGYPFGIDQHERWQNMIDQRFGVHLFTALNNQTTGAKTATEINAMLGEQIVLMAPFLGTLGNTTDLELDRIHSIEAEAGRAPEPPQEVRDSQSGRLIVNYNGPLNQRLRQYYETGNLLTLIANMQAALSVVPDAAVVVEGDELMRRILRSGNSPEEVIRTQDDVDELRAIAAEQEQQRMQAELMAKTASAVPDLSKKIESDSVLSEMLGAA